MPANIYGQNVYSLRQPMWHKLGQTGDVEESAVSVNARMDEVTFEQRPYSITLNGELVASKDIAIVRTGVNEESVIGMTKSRYQLTQPSRYAEIFDQYVNKPVETLGYLGTQGEKFFITWTLPQVDVHGDKVNMFGFLATGFDGKFGNKLYQTGVRVVCNNTWNMAIGDSENNHGGAVYSGKHNQKDHEERLGIWMRYVTAEAEKNVAIYQGLFRKMEETPVSIDVAYNLFAKVYPYKDALGSFHPDELRGKDQSKIDDWNKSQESKRDLAIELFKGKGIAITPTAWGSFNVITELENHIIPSKKDTANSILLGGRQTIMENALFVMQDYAEVR